MVAISDRYRRHTGSRACLDIVSAVPDERDPTHLMQALARLAADGSITPANFRVRFRAPVHGELLRNLARDAGVEAMIEIAPSIPYRDAIAEMMRADALLLLQAANCNQQIPAKAYEYFRTGRPVIALTDPAGDTAATMQKAGCGNIAPLDDAAAIAALIARWVRGRGEAVLQTPSPEAVRSHSRRSRTEELARMLDAVA